MGKYLDSAGLTYLWGKIKNHLKYRNIVPEQAKTFTDVIGTANSWAGATFFFGSIRPTGWYDIWKIKYRIRTYVPGKNAYDMTAEVMISGDQDALRTYSSMNAVSTYYPAYYHELYRLKSAGYTNGYGHSLGVRLYSSYNPTDTNYKRTIVVEILETENCEFTFYDSCLLYASIPGTGTTNYNTYSEMNYVTNGLQETGDANDANYQNRIYYSSSVAAEAIYRYQLLLRTRDGKLLPVSSANNTWTIGKTYSSAKFDPFGEIYYWNSTASYSAGGNLGNAGMYRQILADLRYAFDLNASASYKLTARLPVYLTATPQADGTAILTKPSGSTIGPLSQSLPTSEDGLIYIYLGQAYEDTYPYRLELMINHPVYWYKNGAVREYRPTVDGHTVNADVPANAKFTDTVYTHPSYTAKSSGLYKITVDDTGHVSGTAAVAKTDITALGIPSSDTTYTNMTQSEATTGTATTGRLITAKVLNDTISGKVNTGFSSTNGSTATLASGTWVDTQTVSLTAGTYLITYGVSFSTNATGYRQIALTSSASAPSVDRTMPTGMGHAGAAMNLISTTLVQVTATTTMHLWARQGSGASLSGYPFIKMVKLK